MGSEGSVGWLRMGWISMHCLNKKSIFKAFVAVKMQKTKQLELEIECNSDSHGHFLLALLFFFVNFRKDVGCAKKNVQTSQTPCDVVFYLKFL